MTEDNTRIVVATAGVWSADQLHCAVQALDGLVCRLALSSLIADVEPVARRFHPTASLR